MRQVLFFLFPVVLSVSSAVHGQDHPRENPSVSFNYDAVRSNSNAGQCGCFFLSGGGLDIALPITRRISGVIDAGAQTVSNINGSARGLSLATVAAGPRLTLISKRHEANKGITPFVQTLVGYSHGFNSFFPTSAGTNSSNALALIAGGGLEIALAHHISVRPFEVDYFYTNFSNGSSNQQNNLRFSGGLVIH